MSVIVTSDPSAMKAVKFLFNEAFDEPEVEIDPTAPDAPAPLTNAEVEDLKSELFEAGRQRGLEEARAAAEANITRLVEALSQQVTQLIADRQAIEAALTKEAAQVAHAIAVKLTPRLMKAHPLAEIERLTAECLHEAGSEPRLVIRLSGAMLPHMKARIDGLAQAAGYEGAVILLGDDTLGPLDCRIEWANGGTERRVAPLIKSVEQVVERYLATPSAPADASAQPRKDD